MHFIWFLFLVISAVFAGLGITRHFLTLPSKLEQWGVSLLLGPVILTTLVLAVHWVSGVALDWQLVAFSASAIICPVFFSKRFWSMLLSDYGQVQQAITESSLAQRSMLLICALLIIMGVGLNFFWPITDWDAIALYDFRAQVTTQDGNFERGVELGYYYQYPPFTSLLHIISYVGGFEAAKVWYSLQYAGLILTLTGMVRRQTKSTNKMLATALLLACNSYFLDHSMMAYTNLAYAAFVAVSLLYVTEWFRTQQTQLLVVAGLLMAGSTWTRIAEPFWLLFFIVMGFGFFRKNYRLSSQIFVGLYLTLIFFGVRLLWPTFVQEIKVAATLANPQAIAANETLIPATGVDSFKRVFFITYFETLFSQSMQQLMSSTIDVIFYFVEHIMPVFHIYLVPAAVVFWHDFKHSWAKSWLNWAVVSVSLLVIFVGILWFSFTQSYWQGIGGSASRMSMFLIPLFIYQIMVSGFWRTFFEPKSSQ